MIAEFLSVWITPGSGVSDGDNEKRRGPRNSDQAVGSPKQSLLATP